MKELMETHFFALFDKDLSQGERKVVQTETVIDMAFDNTVCRLDGRGSLAIHRHAVLKFESRHSWVNFVPHSPLKVFGIVCALFHLQQTTVVIIRFPVQKLPERLCHLISLTALCSFRHCCEHVPGTDLMDARFLNQSTVNRSSHLYARIRRNPFQRIEDVMISKAFCIIDDFTKIVRCMNEIK